MPLEIKIVPITNWIGKKTEEPRRSPFRATYQNTIDLLRSELYKADVHGEPQLHMFYRLQDMRKDGNLRANTRPYEQGVKLVFERRCDRYIENDVYKWKIKTVSYPCDTFNFWQDNVRAIALSMEKLRSVERYGVFSYDDIMDRLALPSAEAKKSSVQGAAEFIAKHSGFSSQFVFESQSNLKKAYLNAAAKLHPDKQETGDAGLFTQLTEFNYLLEQHFNNK